MAINMLTLRRDYMLLGVAMVATLLLAALPPVRVAGMPMWFYLAPALVAAYCVPPRLFAAGGVLLMVVAYPVLGHTQDTFVPVASISFALAATVMVLRRSLRTSDTLVLAIGVLLLGAYPLIIAIYFYLFSYELLHATLLASRYVVQSLLAILAAEFVVLAATLTDWRSLSLLRASLGFRPSLVQVAELITSAAVVISLTVSLMMFWRSWESEIGNEIRSAAFARLESRQQSAVHSVADRLRMAAVHARLQGRDGGRDHAGIADAVGEVLGLVGGEADPGRRGSVAVFQDGQLAVSGNWSIADARRAVTLLNERRDDDLGLAAFLLSIESGESVPVTGYLSDLGWMILLGFRDLASAEEFEYSQVMARESVAEVVRVVSVSAKAASPEEDFAVPDHAAITTEVEDGVVWAEFAAGMEKSGQYFLSSLTPGLTAVYKLPSERVDAYASLLHSAGNFRAQVSIWSYFTDFAKAVTFSALVSLTVLGLLLVASRLVISQLVAPIAGLTRIFESWRQFRGGELGSGAALQAMDSSGLSALDDIHSLQQGFRALAQDVMYGERRLSTIAANYDELLRSLPLGVLAVDGASRVQFLNDALGEMTGQRQDALQRLKAQAAQMLAGGERVDEWQLVIDDAPPKSLLLVVNHRLDERGQESGLWVIVTDLTEQKQTSAQLIQASKLATLGEMSTGMAHELNQPLNVISLATSNLRFTIKKGKATPENTLSKLDRIDGAVHRAANIIDHMRAYGRLAGEGLTEINLGEVVAGACNLLGEQLKLANIALLNEVPEEGLTVKGNAIQLEQVLINLVNNAKDAIKEAFSSGSITVDSEVGGGRVRLRVTDTGGGIPDHVLPHIFEPFFTTKPVGKGTGLGGSISYGIVREMQGDIWAENVGAGAQITISLPLTNVELPLGQSSDLA